jgi:hypothetical protein
MVDSKPPFCLFVSSTAWRRHGHRMKPPRWKIEIAASGDESKLWALGQKKFLYHYVGWKSEMFRPQEKCFFLTSPFIELLGDLAAMRCRVSPGGSGISQENSDSTQIRME